MLKGTPPFVQAIILCLHLGNRQCPVSPHVHYPFLLSSSEQIYAFCTLKSILHIPFSSGLQMLQRSQSLLSQNSFIISTTFEGNPFSAQRKAGRNPPHLRNHRQRTRKRVAAALAQNLSRQGAQTQAAGGWRSRWRCTCLWQ